MAKDDYSYIVFKTLVYLYGIFQRKYSYDHKYKELIVKGIDDEYLENILRYMTDDGLISGLKFKKAWGNDYFLCNDLSNMFITSKGINYLKENNTMNNVKDYILDKMDGSIIVNLIKLVFQIR